MEPITLFVFGTFGFVFWAVSKSNKMRQKRAKELQAREQLVSIVVSNVVKQKHVNCPNCNARNNHTGEFCGWCGATLVKNILEQSARL